MVPLLGTVHVLVSYAWSNQSLDGRYPCFIVYLGVVIGGSGLDYSLEALRVRLAMINAIQDTCTKVLMNMIIMPSNAIGRGSLAKPNRDNKAVIAKLMIVTK